MPDLFPTTTKPTAIRAGAPFTVSERSTRPEKGCGSCKKKCGCGCSSWETIIPVVPCTLVVAVPDTVQALDAAGRALR